MEYKTVDAEVKAIDEKGEGVLRFIRFNQEDKDSDITLPGFIGRQAAWLLPAHNWKSDRPPLGDGESFESDGATNFRVKLNLDLPLAREWHTHLKFDYERRRLQQISYGFSPFADGQERGQKDGKSVRFLKPRPDGSPGAKLHEVSFVVVGSGNDTGVLQIKQVEGPLEKQSRGMEPEHPIEVPPVEPPAVLEMTEPDVKRYTIEQLLTLLESQLDHVTFIQDMRAKKGKMLNVETIEMIDETSKRFDVLRAKVKLGAIDRLSIDEELEARYQHVFTQLAKEEELQRAQNLAMNEELLRSAQHRLERIASVLHR
jgi:phage head maturation protease